MEKNAFTQLISNIDSFYEDDSKVKLHYFKFHNIFNSEDFKIFKLEENYEGSS